MSNEVAASAAELSKDRCIALARGIHRTRRALESHAGDFGRQRNLELAHLSIIHVLGLGGETRMKDLASVVILGAATMTRRAQQLEDRGLVQRKRSEQSQREVLIQLTPSGEELFEESFSHLHEQHRTYFDERFDEDEQRVLERLFERL